MGFFVDTCGDHTEPTSVLARFQQVAMSIPTTQVPISPTPISSGDDADDVVSNDHFVMLAEVLPMGILSAGADGGVIYVNEASRRIFNRSTGDLIGDRWRRSIHADDRFEVKTVTDRLMTSGAQQEVTFRVETGLFTRWAQMKFVPLVDHEVTTGWIATVDDVTEDYSSQRRLAHQATHDPLTGLPNRTLLEDRLHQACSRIQRGDSALTVLFVDLDGFKEINDSLGHRAGDEVLIAVADRLSASVRAGDTVARLGGDEFVLVCESLDSDTVTSLVARLDDAISEPLVVSGHELQLRASIGHASASGIQADPVSLMAAADQAMYAIKKQRRSVSE